MLKIGEFARLCGVQTQTIRYYDSVGILPADHVDNFTGYRYYHPDKLETFRRIKIYQELDFSLEDIKHLLDPSEEPASAERRNTLLSDKRRHLQKEMTAVQGKLARLENISHERERLFELDAASFTRPTFSFENDERVLGRWELLGELDAPPDGEAPPPEAPLLSTHLLAEMWQRLVFLPEGRPWWMTRWSRGTLYSVLTEYRTILPLPYTLWEREDGRYMTLRFAYPASIPMGARPRWLLFRQTEHRALSERESHFCVDRTDLPILPDPMVIGEWEGLDFVDTPDEFDPNIPTGDRNHLWIVGLTFTAQNLCIRHTSAPGGVQDQAVIYTHTGDGEAEGITTGVLLRPAEAVAETYCMRRIDGVEYLFVQHKSGDYYYGGMTPGWYVFRRPMRKSTERGK